MAIKVITSVAEWKETYETGSELFFVSPRAREMCAPGKAGCCIFPIASRFDLETQLLAEYIQTLAESGMTSDYIYCSVIRYQKRAHLIEMSKQGVASVIQRMKELGYAGGRVLISYCRNESGALELMRQLRKDFGSIDISVCPAGGEGEALQIGVIC